MGVYAQTNFIIETKNSTIANLVKNKIRTLKDEYHNDFPTKFRTNGGTIEGFMDSGRIQNLEYKCDTIWEAIKDISGVISFQAPFMAEGDGMWFDNNDKKEERKAEN